jgi:hypothetical protein
MNIISDMRLLIEQQSLMASGTANVSMGTFISDEYSNSWDNVVFFSPSWIPAKLGDVWDMIYQTMVWLMWLGFVYYILNRIFGVVDEEQTNELIFTEQQALSYRGQFNQHSRKDRGKLKNMNTLDKVKPSSKL